MATRDCEGTDLSCGAVAADLELAAQKHHVLVIDEERVGRPGRNLLAASEDVAARKVRDLCRDERVGLDSEPETSETCRGGRRSASDVVSVRVMRRGAHHRSPSRSSTRRRRGQYCVAGHS